ncbi:MAG TPA: formate/nitrite transporter family protein [Gemmatimonadaceae bacterium]|nr:formate/nitrite transporter family protein [Gemmatimonadaceae bacterium]
MTQHENPAAELTPEDERRASEEQSLDAPTTHEVIRREGEKELDRSAAALAWSGLAAGLSMGLSLVGEGVLHHGLPDAEWRPLVAKLGYTFGFLAVILGSQQLFTENTLTPMVPLLTKRTGELLRKVLKLWAVVLLANLVGTLLFAWGAARTEIFSPELRATFETVAQEAMRPSALSHFARGIAAGWIIALLVWMLPAASSSKVVVIVLMVWLLGAAKLSHVIAGSVEAYYLAAIGAMSHWEALTHFVLPALAGNVLGGVTLVAAVNHAQVAAK